MPRKKKSNDPMGGTVVGLKAKGQIVSCDHTYQPYFGPVHMVVPDGHIVEQCVHCKGRRTVHKGVSNAGHLEQRQRKSTQSYTLASCED